MPGLKEDKVAQERGQHIARRFSDKMIDQRDIIAANILVKMANGANHGVGRTATSESSESIFPDSKKRNARGNGKLKFHIRIPGASCAEIKQKKRKPNNDFSQSRAIKEELEEKLTDKPISVKKKLHSQKMKVGTCSVGGANDHDFSEKMTMVDIDFLKKSAKMQRFVTGGYSFSVIHLLSAVRSALLTGHARQIFLPSFTIHQIVELVRSKPGDPGILETKETLIDLIRECLKRLSSKSAPLGAAGWKPLAAFEKTSRSWSWIGPVPVSSSHCDDIEVKTSSKSWAIPQKTLMKLVNCVSDWLEKAQQTLQQVVCLPPPPAILLQPINMMERFKDIRPLRSSSTINPSSEQVRNYFRKEEALRYLIPDRAFSYTALDGRKSTVAPLTKSSGKTSARAREHFMLKDNRPPIFTVLCLVRDAAARLPGRIGTRADVCVLVRDSQFIGEEISELQITSVVSGALDRLHYECDPCVRFDREQHLWIYLHGEREDEDFEHGASRSRKRRRTVKIQHVDCGQDDVHVDSLAHPATEFKGATFEARLLDEQISLPIQNLNVKYTKYWGFQVHISPGSVHLVNEPNDMQVQPWHSLCPKMSDKI